MLSELLMRFLQQINKQGLTVDFLLRGMVVFLFVCSTVLWICEIDLMHQTETNYTHTRTIT